LNFFIFTSLAGPGTLPVITKSVFLEIPVSMSAPFIFMISAAAFLFIELSTPVKTTFLPKKGLEGSPCSKSGFNNSP